MKISRIYKIISIIGITFFVISCAKKPINGKLDGRWQVMSIEFYESNEILKPELTYYDFQLNLIQLFRAETDSRKSLTCLGRFNHIEDSLHIRMINTSKGDAAFFGMKDTIHHFRVEELTAKKMILDSGYSRLEFRKF